VFCTTKINTQHSLRVLAHPSGRLGRVLDWSYKLRNRLCVETNIGTRLTPCLAHRHEPPPVQALTDAILTPSSKACMSTYTTSWLPGSCVARRHASLSRVSYLLRLHKDVFHHLRRGVANSSTTLRPGGATPVLTSTPLSRIDTCANPTTTHPPICDLEPCVQSYKHVHL